MSDFTPPPPRARIHVPEQQDDNDANLSSCRALTLKAFGSGHISSSRFMMPKGSSTVVPAGMTWPDSLSLWSATAVRFTNGITVNSRSVSCITILEGIENEQAAKKRERREGGREEKKEEGKGEG